MQFAFLYLGETMPHFRFVHILFISSLLFGCGGGGGTGEQTNSNDTVTIKSIAIGPGILYLDVGDTKQLTATGIYTDNSTKDITNSVNWIVSDTSLATINNKGEIKGEKYGEVTVTAKLDSASMEAKVYVVNNTSLKLNNPPTFSSTSVIAGETIKITLPVTTSTYEATIFLYDGDRNFLGMGSNTNPDKSYFIEIDILVPKSIPENLYLAYIDIELSNESGTNTDYYIPVDNFLYFSTCYVGCKEEKTSFSSILSLDITNTNPVIYVDTFPNSGTIASGLSIPVLYKLSDNYQINGVDNIVSNDGTFYDISAALEPGLYVLKMSDTIFREGGSYSFEINTTGFGSASSSALISGDDPVDKNGDDGTMQLASRIQFNQVQDHTISKNGKPSDEDWFFFLVDGVATDLPEITSTPKIFDDMMNPASHLVDGESFNVTLSINNKVKAASIRLIGLESGYFLASTEVAVPDDAGSEFTTNLTLSNYTQDENAYLSVTVFDASGSIGTAYFAENTNKAIQIYNIPKSTSYEYISPIVNPSLVTVSASAP
ncbi:MAG: Ig-like domain-containing protein [Gammaproteobacteria bacterium]|nr:Ig-like domain-containing protein [Gammaproteobacteria bacterium]